VLGAIITAAVTPFDADLRIDSDAFATLVRFLKQNSSDSVVVSGTTGEASTLDDDEKVELFRIACAERTDGFKVVAGTGSNDTAHSVHLTERAAEVGVDAVLAVTPYYNKPPREGLIAHFRAIADVGLPVVLYNIPSRTALNMPPDVIAEIAELPHVVGLKQANPEPRETAGTVAIPNLSVYAGNDDMLLPVLEAGGDGVISVASHLVGPQMAAIVAALERDDPGEARRLDAALEDIYTALFVTSNPILIKAALQMIGVIPSDGVRLPLVSATSVQREILRTVLERQGLLARA
jgi:4-hydroxy-tetrahydrodipicolinate synthase